MSSHRQNWDLLSKMLDKKHAYSQEELAEIGRLYRSATNDFAIAQRDYPQHEVTKYLNLLVARAHAFVYQTKPFSLKMVRTFFTHTIPKTFRSSWPYFATASLIFWLPFLLGLITILAVPSASVFAIPVGMEAVQNAIEDHQPWFYFEGDEQASASGMITSNNIRVSILAFAGGMTAGVLTTYVLLLNGLMAGGLVGFAINHQFFDLTNFIIGHGVIELNMICLAGAAGLCLAWAIIRPGYLSRQDALFLAGRRAIVLLITCALFLIVAGLIEGFISPREHLNPLYKWLVGVGSGILMYAYLLLAGRDSGK